MHTITLSMAVTVVGEAMTLTFRNGLIAVKSYSLAGRGPGSGADILILIAPLSLPLYLLATSCPMPH
jgi:hypothetical protein